MNEEIYIVSGGNGHLGRLIVESLLKDKKNIIALIKKGDNTHLIDGVQYHQCDIRDIDSYECVFKDKQHINIIHTAAIIDIQKKVSPLIYDTNVVGTKNLVDLALKYKAEKFLYVSSVHAIEEKGQGEVILETKTFSKDLVVGSYAKTKAMATKIVLDACSKGLNAVIVHPSGILGPYDYKRKNHLCEMVENIYFNKLPAIVDGGYDFVDVRDVVDGCILAMNKGKIGETYLLTNQYYKIKDIVDIINHYKKPKQFAALPLWVASLFAHPYAWFAKLIHIRPLYTPYSLHTIKAKYTFSHEKADKELGYTTRSMEITIKDTIDFIKSLN